MRLSIVISRVGVGVTFPESFKLMVVYMGLLWRVESIGCLRCTAGFILHCFG